MGLDNFPHKYPCKTQGTAVMVQRTSRDGDLLTEEDGSPSMSISCEATQACGGCPYRNAYEKSGLAGGAVYGMFGTDCWYRGKWGNYLLSQVGIDDDDTNFYGDQEDGTYKSPESCLTLADIIGEELSSVNDQEVLEGLKYAEWYLRWVAEECDGMDAWY